MSRYDSFRFSQLLDGAERAMADEAWSSAGELVTLAAQRVGREKDVDVARLLRLSRLVAPHDSVVAFNMACAQMTGRYGETDHKAAARELRRLSHDEDLAVAGRAHSILGSIAAGELGGKPNPAKAFSHFDQAARLDAPGAAFQAAISYRYGLGTPPDRDKALSLLRRAHSEEPGHPGVCLELAVAIASTGTAEAQDEARRVLASASEFDAEMNAFMAVFEGDHASWKSAADFAADHERRTLHRFAMDDVIERCNMLDRMLRIRDIPAARMAAFARIYMGWKLTAVDPFAHRFGDRIADVVTRKDARVPVFAISGMMDDDDPMIKRTKAAIAKKHKNAVLLTPYLGFYGAPDGPTMLSSGLLLKGGKWSEFALSPGGFDRVLDEAGSLTSDPDAYLAAHHNPELPPDLSTWMRDGGTVAELKRMVAASKDPGTKPSGRGPR